MQPLQNVEGANSRAAISPDYELDPAWRQSVREAWFVMGMWVAGVVWTMIICGLMGYEPPANGQPIATVFGVPTWVFWGVVVPWLLSNLVTIWFCLTKMQDVDLEEGAVPDAG